MKKGLVLEDRYKGYWGRLDSRQISLLCEGVGAAYLCRRQECGRMG